MKDKQNQFYTSISKYYSEIFPYKPVQLQFVKNGVGDLNKKQILDIGCATGELAFNLAKEFAEVTGIDLNEDLLQQAKNNKIISTLKFQSGNMLELKKDFQPNQFDAVLCFGNTLVHLPNFDLIGEMLMGVYSVLKTGGSFLIQILNYDYILAEQVSELPIIETENIKFVRKYEFEKSSPLIRFQTDLHLKKEGRVISNETVLLALKSAELIDLLRNSGFKEIKLFSNFKKDSFGGKHLPLVVSMVK
ncbi:MAG: class I SAM-dependent methyltransferase [Prolixibacteraceae bacterium]|nr:class I SAM-dependent methyltransferase [Prolixibacteraceae bacterium]MBT6767111.1 class I SAM-dependent methyltransferase [Prolixibacteraceae bacterium]MBT7000914.1 class I SAM-dependent methyltransferase [Prolixibacteraceae bacterium]MBT7394124.1 class I SAM-dependent methyltransferase [Prolixibacteraceae bacterium]